MVYGARIAAILVVSLALSVPGHELRQLFERARLFDESNRNLDEAIRLYRAVADGAGEDGALAARALYRLGLLYERRGKESEARQTFSRLVAQHPSSDPARRAAMRLASSSGKNAPVAVRAGAADSFFSATIRFAEPANLLVALDERRHRLHVVTSRTYDPPAGKTPARTLYAPSHLVTIDTRTQAVVRTVTLPSYVDHIVFDEVRNLLYGTAQMDGHVLVFDPATSALRKIPVPGFPTGIAASVRGRKLYVGSQGFGGNDRLLIIDADREKVVGSRDLEGVGGAVHFNETTNRVYALTSGKTRVYEGERDSFLTDLEGLGVAWVDPHLNRVYAETVPSVRQTLEVIDGSTHGSIASLPLWSPTPWLAADHRRNRLYVGLPQKRQLAVLDAATHTELGRFFLAGSLSGLVMDPTTDRLYATLSSPAATVGIADGGVLAEELPMSFDDEFDSQQAGAWSPFGHELAPPTGTMRVAAWEGDRGPRRRVVERRFRGDAWTLEIRGSYFSGSSGGTRHLFLSVLMGVPPSDRRPNRSEPAVVNAVQIARAREDWNGCCAGDIRHTIADRGNIVATAVQTPHADDRFRWRIRRAGRTVTVERGDENERFVPVVAHTFGPEIDGLVQSILVGAESYAATEARIELERVTLRTSPPAIP